MHGGSLQRLFLKGVPVSIPSWELLKTVAVWGLPSSSQRCVTWLRRRRGPYHLLGDLCPLMRISGKVICGQKITSLLRHWIACSGWCCRFNKFIGHSKASFKSPIEQLCFIIAVSCATTSTITTDKTLYSFHIFFTVGSCQRRGFWLWQMKRL